MASGVAYVFNYPRLLRNGRHAQKKQLVCVPLSCFSFYRISLHRDFQRRLASDMAYFPDNSHILYFNCNEQSKNFQEKSEYFPISYYMRDIISLGRLRLWDMASDMVVVPYDSRVLYVREQY